MCTMNKAFKRYYTFSVLGILLLSGYPIYMGLKVIYYMSTNGTVISESYPKYIIPYTPICIALIAGILLMPLIIRIAKRFASFIASAFSIGVFFIAELLFENHVIIRDTVETTMESWQMYMCYIAPEQFETRVWTPVDILIGEYSPLYKLHFYIISIVLILTILNCFYGFGKLIITGNKSKLKPLVLQTAVSILFLALCIFACFTAFFRTGELIVSPLSAVLMALFFIVFGVCVGIYSGSFLWKRSRLLAQFVPAVIASLATIVMYIGEMILLHGNLYSFGSSLFFNRLGVIPFAPVDLIIILMSGIITALVLKAAGKLQQQ